MLKKTLPALLAFFILAAASSGRCATVNVEEFKHLRSWSRFHTDQIQAAIDACAQRGGGAAVVPSGVWVTGTLFFRSGVTLRLERGATLVAAPKRELFPPIVPKTDAGSNAKSDRTLLYAEDLTDIGVVGPGAVHNLGLVDPLLFEPHERPHVLKFVNCENVVVRDASFNGAANWTQLYQLCRKVRISDVEIYSQFGSNSDGIDLDSCTDVVVERCVIDTYNDSIALKSTTPTPCNGVVVRDCVLRSGKRGIKIGTESIGGFSDIRFENCTVSRGRRTLVNPMPDELRAGVFVSTVDGGDIRNLVMDNIHVDDARSLFFMVTSRRDPDVNQGSIRNVVLSNFTTDSEPIMPSIIAADAPGSIHGLRIENFFMEQAERNVSVLPPSATLTSKPGKPKYTMFVVSGVDEGELIVLP